MENEDRLVFHYRRRANLWVGVLLVSLPVILLVQLLRGNDGQPSTLSDYVTAESLAGLFCGIGVYLLLSYRNQRIEIIDGRVVWIGPSGKVKIDVQLSEVDPQVIAYVDEESKSYYVRTPKGKLRWQPSITDADRLRAILSREA